MFYNSNLQSTQKHSQYGLINFGEISNELDITFPCDVDKETLLSLFLCYGEFDKISIANKNVQISFYKVTSALKCFGEIKKNFSYFNQKNVVENVKMVRKSFEGNFFVAFDTTDPDIIKSNVNSNCLLKMILTTSKLLAVFQKQIDNQTFENLVLFNDLRDKEKFEFFLRRIKITSSMINKKGENLKKTYLFSCDDSSDEESDLDLNTYQLIGQFVKTADEGGQYLYNNMCYNYYNFYNNNRYNYGLYYNTALTNNSNSLNNNFNNNDSNDCNDNSSSSASSDDSKIDESRKKMEKSIETTLTSSENQKTFTGIIQRNTPVDERKKYVIILEKVISDEDKRTTLMIKNIPRKVDQSYFKKFIDKNYKNEYNFLYLPIDFIKTENAGYAFINFKQNKHIAKFFMEFNEKPWPFCNSKKCFISYARIQGFKSIVQHFSTSRISNVDDDNLKPFICYD